MATDPRVDAYFKKVPSYAHPVFVYLRQLVHSAIPDIDEDIKWGKPAFTYKGKNLASFAAFKAHAIFVIHGCGRQGEADGQSGKIASLADLPGENSLIAKLQDAKMRIEHEGSAVKKRPAALRQAKPELPIPPEFTAALAANPAAKATLDAFAPSHRREYVEWITEAKRPETRDGRIAQAIAFLAEGKKRNWKYENC